MKSYEPITRDVFYDGETFRQIVADAKDDSRTQNTSALRTAEYMQSFCETAENIHTVEVGAAVDYWTDEYVHDRYISKQMTDEIRSETVE